ncbi:MAG: stage III sporulation protein AB [Clostridia bacterium]|nr:stage III sporulation protein AB [Clostridia bacterium]
MNWLGAALLIFSGYAVGVLLASEEKRALEAVEAMLSLLNYMERRISESRLPINEIFLRFENDFLEQRGFLAQIRSGGGVRERWQSALMLVPLEEEARRELALFGEELGILSLQEQKKRLEAAVVFLNGERERLKQRLPARQKSIKTVCLLVGALTAIVLL